jgi:hypothetical protein
MSDFQSRDLRWFSTAVQAQEGSETLPSGPPPSGHSLVRPTTGLSERVIGAQPVAVHRDEQKIMQKLKAFAAAAGDDWFYRFPVKKKDGGQDWIEGPSIKLANSVARYFGNNVTEVREVDVGDAWVFYARFTDIETGYSTERAYRQRKSQTSMRTKDVDRQQDIAYQIGQSKSIRNVIVNGLQLFCDYAFEEARNSLVDKIGKDLAGWRERTVAGLARLPVELARVERIVGRPVKEWLAPNIAQVISMARSVQDGMATLDETFPPLVELTSPTPPDRGGGAGDQAAGADRRDSTPDAGAPDAAAQTKSKP